MPRFLLRLLISIVNCAAYSTLLMGGDHSPENSLYSPGTGETRRTNFVVLCELFSLQCFEVRMDDAAENVVFDFLPLRQRVIWE